MNTALNDKQTGSDHPRITATRTHVPVRQKNRIVLVPIGEVIMFKAENKYIAVITKDKEYCIAGTLNNLEAEFTEHFIRIHRNTLASTLHITALTRDEDGRWSMSFRHTDETRELSRRQTPVVRKWLKLGKTF